MRRALVLRIAIPPALGGTSVAGDVGSGERARPSVNAAIAHRSWRGRAFTLVELMIVIGIIAVLAAVAMPNLKEARAKAQMRACYENERKISGAIEMYNLDLNTKVTQISPSFLSSLVSRQYLKTYPYCPTTGQKDAYSISGLSGDEGNVTCVVHGNMNH